MTKQTSQSGFTAVELLITLFVAAAFLIAGYQLFSVVIKDGGQARAESTAGNVAYDYLRRYAPQATNPCTAATVLNNSPITISGLSNVKITVEISCPPGYGTTGLSKIDTTITYNTPQQTAKYSTFTNGVVSNTPLDVTNGLVGWWKLNGDTITSAGSLNGTAVNGPLPTIGQNGLSNQAYSFNGSDQYISVANGSSLIASSAAMTASGWVYSTSTAAHRTYFGLRNDTTADFYVTQLNGSTNLECRIRNSEGTMYNTTNTYGASLNQWMFVTLVYSGSTLTCYVNGASIGSIAATGTITSATVPFYMGSYAATNDLVGNLDDVRLYNRALSLTEIQTLYNGGGR